MNLIESPVCTFRKREEETDYLFWTCPIIPSFILDVEQWLLDRQFTLSKKDMFFGSCKYIKYLFIFLILHLKYYIFQ